QAEAQHSNSVPTKTRGSFKRGSVPGSQKDGLRLNRKCFFHQDQPGESVVQREARLAYLTDDVRVAGNQSNNLSLTEPNLPQTARHFRRRAKLANAHRPAG